MFLQGNNLVFKNINPYNRFTRKRRVLKRFFSRKNYYHLTINTTNAYVLRSTFGYGLHNFFFYKKRDFITNTVNIVGESFINNYQELIDSGVKNFSVNITNDTEILKSDNLTFPQNNTIRLWPKFKKLINKKRIRGKARKKIFYFRLVFLRFFISKFFLFRKKQPILFTKTILHRYVISVLSPFSKTPTNNNITNRKRVVGNHFLSTLLGDHSVDADSNSGKLRKSRKWYRYKFKLLDSQNLPNLTYGNIVRSCNTYQPDFNMFYRARKSLLTKVFKRTFCYTPLQKQILTTGNLFYTLINYLNYSEPVSYLNLEQHNLTIKPLANKFILANTGLFFLSKKLFNQTQDNGIFYEKFLFKKSFFSFLAPNQLKKSVLTRKKRIVSARFFKPVNANLKSYNATLYTNNHILNYMRNYFTLRSIQPSLHSSYCLPLNTIIFEQSFFHNGPDESFKSGEVFIKRIRFKPGYQRIWRRARNSIKESLNLKYKYQYRLTRYLMRFSRKLNNYFLYFSESSIMRTIMYSKLLPDVKTLSLFTTNKLVYLNGGLVTDLDRLVYTGDFIQLLVSKWYYIFYRWLLNWTINRNRKLKKLIYRKGLASRYKLTKTKKTQSNYTPNWIFNTQYDLLDVRANIEVDYFTLSVFYLYDPFFINIHPINDLFSVRHNIYRMYNWKYIT